MSVSLTSRYCIERAARIELVLGVQQQDSNVGNSRVARGSTQQHRNLREEEEEQEVTPRSTIESHLVFYAFLKVFLAFSAFILR